jgi:hypothetical protein
MTAWDARFPDLFGQLTAPQRRALSRTLSNHQLEGLQPDRTFVANLVAMRTGKIDAAEYRRRAQRWAQQHHRTARAG